MPAYKYVGYYPLFFGSGMPTESGSGTIHPGEVVEFDSHFAPVSLPLWVPVDSTPAEQVPQSPEPVTEAPIPPPAPNEAPIPPASPVAPSVASWDSPAVTAAVNPNTQPPLAVH